MGKVLHYLRDGMNGLVNRMTGTGTARDPNSHNSYIFSKPGNAQLEAIYRSNWIARKIVDIPIEDTLRQGWSWTAEDDIITQIEAEEKRLNIHAILRQSLTRDAIYGGSAFVMGTADADISTELRVERLGKGSLKYLTPFHAEDLHIESLSREPDSLGQPTMFVFKKEGGADLRIHPSRVITFCNRPIEKPLSRMTWEDYWGDSRLANILSDIAGASTALTGGSRLMGELAIWVFKVNGMAEMLSTTGGEESVQKLLTLTTTLKSSLNSIAVDAEDDVSLETANTAGIGDTIRAFMQNVAGAADIPYTRFMSASPDGMNATGASDFRNYYDRLVGNRTARIDPQLEKFDQVFLRSTLGRFDDQIYRSWKNLWQLNEVEQTELDGKKINIFGIMLDKGLVHDHVIETVLKTMMIESPTFPGAEEAIEEAKSIPDPRDEEEEEESTALPGKKPAAAAAKAPSAEVKLRIVKDSDGEEFLIEDKGFNESGIARHPPGSSKGGQFAPKGKAGAGSGGSGNVKHGYAAAYTQAQKAHKSAQADYTAVFANKSATNQEKADVVQKLMQTNVAKKQALKDYYANKGTKAVATAEAAKPAGLTTAEREAGIAAVKKEKGQALKEYKAKPTGSDEKKAALAEYNKKAAEQKKMEEGLEKAKAGDTPKIPTLAEFEAGAPAATMTTATKPAKIEPANDKLEKQVAKKFGVSETHMAKIAADPDYIPDTYSGKQAKKAYYAEMGAPTKAGASTATVSAAAELGIMNKWGITQSTMDVIKSDPSFVPLSYSGKAAKAAYQELLDKAKTKAEGDAIKAGSSLSPGKLAVAKHNTAMDAVLKAHPHPTFGKKEAEATIAKGMAGKPLGYNEQQLFNTYQKSMNPNAGHASVKPIVSLGVESNLKLDSNTSYKEAQAKYAQFKSQSDQTAYLNALAAAQGGVMADSSQLKWAGYETPLSPNEKEGLRKYTGNAYASINSSLRNNMPSGQYGQTIKDMDAAFLKAKASKDFIVQRGFAKEAVDRALKNGEFKVGATMVDRGFVSATSSTQVANAFKGGYGGYHMMINVKKGQAIAPVDLFSKNSGEKEFILPRNSAFKISHIDHDTKTFVVDLM